LSPHNGGYEPVLLTHSLFLVPAKAPSPPTETPAAKAEDVGSLESIIAALYDVISGPAGQKRDWNRMRSLFAPEGKMGLTRKRPDGTAVMRLFTPEDYIAENAKAIEDGGFFESEIVKHVDRYGNMAQVFSSYEGRRAKSDEKPFMRGINSLLLWNDGKRWWILNIFWQAEGPDNPLPANYLKSGG
jgi:hypothetical protein